MYKMLRNGIRTYVPALRASLVCGFLNHYPNNLHLLFFERNFEIDSLLASFTGCALVDGTGSVTVR